ncbi:hypothetical protein AG1IA_00099 [Rhizoctonia solani AG-1 IA]|uniref:DUF1742-domain-containing protein n=1 Tax=Thanatephorus cucumeris (strain AG1-IA) TaxID=983506 RepID=L8XB14_THACA|nr:hypothetical protein AG1IA_00099 [Rhizoctonia solani AG-1 IA]
MSAPFLNVYYKRRLQGHGAYICNKPTTIVLSTQPVLDFIYTCDSHLSDPGFATLQAPAVSPTPSASTEEIAKIKAEWEQEQAEKEKKDEGDKKDEKKDEEKEKAVSSPKPSSPAPVAGGSTTPKHDKYVLHRQFYTMRLTEHRRRRQQKEVDALAPKLSGAGLSVPKQMG